MKKVMIFTVCIVLSFAIKAQDISTISTGIQCQINDLEAYNDMFHKDMFRSIYTEAKVLIDNDSIVKVLYSIDSSDYSKNKVFVIIDRRLDAVSKAFQVLSNKGVIFINKKYFNCADYTLALLTNSGTSNLKAGFSVKRKYNQKLQLGEYVVYWKENKFTYKYIGLE
ncbi:MAG TPA: hypothetical protein VK172_14810 [Lentimicrobium sp.]|nr:hypothetical protein [Bacteroidales bacterium]HLO92433.1 hypothetical protein [Lentimicrobium sp.]